MKATNRAKELLGERGRVNVSSYNRLVLITGEVPNEADKAAVERAVASVENVQSVVNELVVGPVHLDRHAFERPADRQQGQGELRRREGPDRAVASRSLSKAASST